ncbi:MAG: O-antigen ligase family protein, partial [Terracidiphilus sp.]
LKRDQAPSIRDFSNHSFVKFVRRYPIFLLALGPPLFRTHAIDATGGVIDLWSVFQVAWLSLIAGRAIIRLTSVQSIAIPRQVQSILRLAFFIGVLFLISAAYSPSRLVSAAYSIIYFLTLICVVEFVVDVYRTPPPWISCLIHLRFCMVLLVILVLLTLPFNPSIVLTVLGKSGIRLSGGPVGPIALISPVIAIVSAYTFLHSLESRVRAAFLFSVGLAGTLATQARGAEIALFIALSLIAFDWAKTSRRAGLIVICGFVASIIFGGAIVGVIGGGQIWNIFNRGQSIEGIVSASGRTEIWKFVIQYCMSHPLGMGYVAGFRMLFKTHFTLGSGLSVDSIGNTHNAFIQFLADAGWAAMALYLVMLAKVLALGLRFRARLTSAIGDSEGILRHALNCAIVLLIFCLVEGMDASDCAVPLRVPFYFQNLVIAIILGASANALFAFRVRHFQSVQRSLVKQPDPLV